MFIIWGGRLVLGKDSRLTHRDDWGSPMLRNPPFGGLATFKLDVYHDQGHKSDLAFNYPRFFGCSWRLLGIQQELGMTRN